MILRIDAISDKGCVDDHNEDMALVGEKLVRDGKYRVVSHCERPIPVAVADGLGGAKCGEKASEMVLTSLSDFCADAEEVTVETLGEWGWSANHELLQYAEKSDNEGMATTLTGVVAANNRLLLINAGDSRVYRLRDRDLHQLSKDHSMRELTKRPDYPGDAIYNCFGVAEGFFIDINDITGRIMTGDTIVICSDGLTDMLSDEEIETSDGVADMLMQAKKAGGRDNITIITIHIENHDKTGDR